MKTKIDRENSERSIQEVELNEKDNKIMFRNKTKDRKAPKKAVFIKKIKSCPLSAKGAPIIDYKNVRLS